MKTSIHNDFVDLDPHQLRNVLACMKKIADKGGVVVVMEDDCLVTTYNYSGFRK